MVVVRPFRAGVCSMCSFVHANATLGSTVVLPAKGSTRLQSCVLHCKTYLDKCYMQRADSDFNIMKMSNNAFKAIIVSLEDSVKSDSFNFL